MTSSAVHLSAADHIDAIRNWGYTQGKGWIYVIKMLLAVTMAYWLSMQLSLPSTRSAALTVIIVMEPRAGNVFAKSMARIIGTIMGLAASLVLISLFNQHPPLFILGTALWAAFCVAGAVRYRDLRAYSFLLAGYTVGMVGIPGAIETDHAMMTLIGRMLAVILGIICGGLVSALIFPGSIVGTFKAALTKRLPDMAGHAAELLQDKASRTHEQVRLAFAGQAVGIEALRRAASTESPEYSARRKQLTDLNLQFMSLGTRLHALARLRERILQRDKVCMESSVITNSIKFLQAQPVPLLEKLAEKHHASIEIKHKLRELDLLCTELKLDIRRERSKLIADADYIALAAKDQQHSLEMFDTFCELLYRFCDQLRIYCEAFARLSDLPAHGEESMKKPIFHTSVNNLHALATGVRTAVIICLIATFWILSAWENGMMLLQNAIIATVLTAAAANPKAMARSVAEGAVVGLSLGFVINFFLLPTVDGFPLMITAMSPIFIIGTLMTLNPKWAGLGMGAMINFCFIASPSNPAVFDPQQFANNSLAGILGMSTVAVLLGILLPPSGRWLSRSLIKDIRKQVGLAARAPLAGLESRIDSHCRDLLNQTYSFTAGQADVQKNLLNWHASVMSVSHALVELRQAQQFNQTFAPEQVNKLWEARFEMLRQRLETLYDTPNAENYAKALYLTERLIDQSSTLQEPEETLFEQAPMRQSLSYLHFIHAALTDDEGPLGRFMA